MCESAEAISFVVYCGAQEEVDYCWSWFAAGNSEIACGRPKDKFGLCWQVVPACISDAAQ